MGFLFKTKEQKAEALAEKIRSSVDWGEHYVWRGEYFKAEKELKFALKRGDPRAYFYYGMCHLGWEMKKQAEEWFLKAAEQGVPGAYYQLGKMHLGREISVSYFDKYLEIGADKDQLRDAACQCADYYHPNDWSPSRDDVKALHYALKAAEMGKLSSQRMCARLYLDGKGVQPDPEKALYWKEKYQEGYDNPEFSAYFEKRYKEVLQGINQLSEAIALYEAKEYEKAAALMYTLADRYDLPEAKYRYGMMRLDGLRAPEDHEENPDHWLYMAALSEHAEAQYIYAGMCDRQAAETGSLYAKRSALRFYQGAARHGNREAAERVEKAEALSKKALAYDGPDEKEALRLLEEAAQAGYPDAICKLGERYLDGKGVTQDIEKGLDYIETLSSLEDKRLLKDVYYKCAKRCLQAGDKRKASRYYALDGLHFTSGKLRYELGDKEDAVSQFISAAAYGDKQAARWLGYMYITGDGVDVDYREGERYMEQSGIHGFSEINAEVAKMRGQYVPPAEEQTESVQSALQEEREQTGYSGAYSFPGLFQSLCKVVKPT